MLFTWYEYDNVAPFENVHAHSDSLDALKDVISGDGFCKDQIICLGEPRYCIFDRIEGVIIQ